MRGVSRTASSAAPTPAQPRAAGTARFGGLPDGQGLLSRNAARHRRPAPSLPPPPAPLHSAPTQRAASDEHGAGQRPGRGAVDVPGVADDVRGVLLQAGGRTDVVNAQEAAAGKRNAPAALAVQHGQQRGRAPPHRAGAAPAVAPPVSWRGPFCAFTWRPRPAPPARQSPAAPRRVTMAQGGTANPRAASEEALPRGAAAARRGREAARGPAPFSL